MRIWAGVVTLLLLFCALLMAETSEQTPAAAKPQGKTEDCASFNRKSAYDLVARLPHTRAKVNFYDVDGPEPPYAHDPVCLSVKSEDTLAWYSSQRKPFKLKLSHMSGGNHCGSHPFAMDPPSTNVLGHYSGPARPETVGCIYAVKFERAGKKEADPHIRIGP
jgi:hypothetical protein